MVRGHEDLDRAKDALIDGWAKADPGQQMILAYTNCDVEDLNQRLHGASASRRAQPGP